MIIFVFFQCCWSSCRSRRDWPTDEYSPSVAGLGRASQRKPSALARAPPNLFCSVSRSFQPLLQPFEENLPCVCANFCSDPHRNRKGQAFKGRLLQPRERPINFVLPFVDWGHQWFVAVSASSFVRVSGRVWGLSMHAKNLQLDRPMMQDMPTWFRVMMILQLRCLKIQWVQNKIIHYVREYEMRPYVWCKYVCVSWLVYPSLANYSHASSMYWHLKKSLKRLVGPPIRFEVSPQIFERQKKAK